MHFQVADNVLSYVGTIRTLRPVTLRYHKSSNFYHLVKCIFCGVWVQNFVWNFKGHLWNSHKILNPYTAKCAFYCLVFLRVSYDIFELWRHKPYWGGPLEYLRSHFSSLCVPCKGQVGRCKQIDTEPQSVIKASCLLTSRQGTTSWFIDHLMYSVLTVWASCWTIKWSVI